MPMTFSGVLKHGVVFFQNPHLESIKFWSQMVSYFIYYLIDPVLLDFLEQVKMDPFLL